MLYIDTASYSNPGGHEINEDSFCCGSDFFAVADGLGGHINGEEASRCAIEYLKKSAHGNYGEDTVKSLLEGANSEVYGQANGAKTTIAILFAENGILRYANVGDSRVYIFRNDRLLAMTKDHSVCRAAVDMGTMEFDDIRQSEDRSRLLKVLGNDEKLNVPKGYPPVQMQEGDAFLICSDGFWDYVLESEMEADLLKSDSPRKWLNFMLKRHIAAAMNKGDNYTAICGMVKTKQEPSYITHKKLYPAFLIAFIAIAAIIGAAVLHNASKLDDTERESQTFSLPDTSETTSESDTASESTEITSESDTVSESTEITSESDTDTESTETASESDTVSESSETAAESGTDSDSIETAAESGTDSESAETTLESGTDSESSETAAESSTDSESAETTAENNISETDEIPIISSILI